MGQQWADLLNDLLDAFRALGKTIAPADEDVATANGAENISAIDEEEQAEQEERSKRPLARQAPMPYYFLGQLLLLPRPQARGHFRIYDGQQRLTTLTILLCATPIRMRTIGCRSSRRCGLRRRKAFLVWMCRQGQAH